MFSGKHAKQTLQWCKWDYKIDLTPNFVPKKTKEIQLSDVNQKELDKFITKNLAKGYTHSSDSSQTSIVFFIGKKDGSKLMVINYQYLNKYTVKNNYSILLIEELV